ncbi:hypothetical protein B0A89_02850 [Paracoccus contaminans]|uniref:DUF2946 domain-containing protein n=1 Tax=Paracoccus contaminans TaxID=1945662 RepID=A0A1W6CV25_9RHOB|nr:hypothetical protein B0A89_02850 [Paracoccus contaminans]
MTMPVAPLCRRGAVLRLLACALLALALGMAGPSQARMRAEAAGPVLALGKICGHDPASLPPAAADHCLACLLAGAAPLPAAPSLAPRGMRLARGGGPAPRLLPVLAHHHPCPMACGPPLRVGNA